MRIAMQTDGTWDNARATADRLLERLGDGLVLYFAFYRCDNTTEGKRARLLRLVPQAGRVSGVARCHCWAKTALGASSNQICEFHQC